MRSTFSYMIYKTRPPVSRVTVGITFQPTPNLTISELQTLITGLTKVLEEMKVWQ